MIQVNFTTFELDADTKQWVQVPVAELTADGQDVTISGPHADWISPEISIVDPATAERITRAADAERWARLLPFAYRDGELTVEVAEVAGVEPAAAAFRYSTAA